MKASGIEISGLVNILSFALVLATLGLYYAFVDIAVDNGLNIRNPKIWSSRFPENALVRTAVQLDIESGKLCGKKSQLGKASQDDRVSRYITILPNDPSVLLSLAKIAQRCGQVNRMASLVRRAIRLGPSDTDILLDSYKLRRTVSYADPALALELDHKLENLWLKRPKSRPDIAAMIRNCWSCNYYLKRGAPEFLQRIQDFVARRP